MNFFKNFFISFLLLNLNFTKNALIENTGSYLSKILKQFKNGYYDSEIKIRKDEISLRLKIIKKIFENVISKEELEIVISHYYNYINNFDYINYLLDENNYKKLIDKLNLAISSKDFYLLIN